MSRIFITGSSDGLGLLSGKALAEMGHDVVFHARNAQRREDLLKKLPGSEKILVGDLSNIAETINLAEQVNASGQFDAVIHNAGVYRDSAKEIFYVNTLSPYILTCLIQKPKRLIYLTSGLQQQGHLKLESFKSDISRITYSDSKLHILMLSMAVARKWNDVFSNAVNPGWVPTKMGGSGAPDSLQKGYETQVWLAVSNDDQAKVSGKYFYHKKEKSPNPESEDIILQDKFLALCQEITGIALPK
jgi:NAD(P)-dependent dehydrogenase (short-subunit alcohol dehydrogenase family)